MEQEARILARIDHPNVVQVRNVFEEGEALVLELEYMSGGDLLSGTPIGGVPEADAVALMGGVLSGLQAVHDAGLVHRDVKPENILLAANGVPKITDLGIAHDPDAREKTRLGARMGTLEYMAPEQIQGNGVDARADVYAAGIVLYRILTGEFPYEATSDFEWQVAHVQEEPNVELLELLSSPALTSAILGALAKRPEERLGSALEFRQALEEVGEPIERPASAVPKASGPQPVVRDLDRSESGAMEKRAPPTSIPASPKAYPKPDTATRSWREGVNGPEHDKPGNDCGFAGFTLGATFVEACVFDRWTEPDKEEAAARAEARAPSQPARENKVPPPTPRCFMC